MPYLSFSLHTHAFNHCINWSSMFKKESHNIKKMLLIRVWEAGNSERWWGDIIKQKERISMFMCTFQKTSF